jgi:hypothetical protein
VKRGAPEPGDYVILRPGKRLRAVVDLTQVYALGAPGRYQVAFDGWLHDVTQDQPARSVPRSSCTVRTWRCRVTRMTVQPGLDRFEVSAVQQDCA